MSPAAVEDARRQLLEIFQAGVDRVEGCSAVGGYLRQHPIEQPVSLVAVGKAAQSMALGAADALGDQLRDGLVVSKHGHIDSQELTARRLTGLEAEHPVPDAGSLRAGQALLDFIARIPREHFILFLISGGASSLVEVLRPGVELEDLKYLNRWLLANGMPIQRMNQLRRQLSRIKGGGLLDYLQGRAVLALLISDVRGDDPAVIGSGLLVPPSDDGSSLDGLALPEALARLVKRGASHSRPTVLPPELHILASLRDARNAAADRARQLGFEASVSHAFISGEAENAGRRMALELLDAWPGVYIWGGEPGVHLPTDPGRGGRAQQLALAAAGVIDGRDDILFLAAGTDGTDGPGQDAGALVDGATLARGRRAGFDAADCLARADAGSLLAASGDLVTTGPTGTNVMDLMIGLKLPSKSHG